MSNDDLVKKVDLALSDLAKNGGGLTAEHSERFMYQLMRGWEFELLRKITHHLNRAAMHEKNKNHEWANGSRRKAIKFINLLLRYVGRKMEHKRTVSEEIVDLIAERVGNDFEEMILNGDAEIGREEHNGLFSGKSSKIGFGTRIRHVTGIDPTLQAEINHLDEQIAAAESILPADPDSGHTEVQLREVIGWEKDEPFPTDAIQTCSGSWIPGPDDLWYFIKDNPHED